MGFDVAAGAYDRFMGLYSALLAPQFADFAGVRAGVRALDVGCGPGALTAELLDRLGPDGVVAVDPSQPFAEAARERYPGVAVEVAPAEDLPFGDDEFDVAAAQLVVPFMADPVAGLREMARVTRPGGTVAACVWDHAGGLTPLAAFWRAVGERDPGARAEAPQAGAGEGRLPALFGAAGLMPEQETPLQVSVRHDAFESWWEPFTLGVGPAGAYVAGLDDDARTGLRERCRELVGDGPVTIAGRAWSVRARA